MAFTRPENITKILSQGPLLGFGSLSGILSLYVPVTMQEHGLPLPSAGVSAWLSTRCVALGLQPSCCQWLLSPRSFVRVTHSKIMGFYLCTSLCVLRVLCWSWRPSMSVGFEDGQWCSVPPIYLKTFR